MNLYYYNARYYDAALGRFIQPDTIVQNVLNNIDWNKYTYVRNNPINFGDPSGYGVDCGIGERCWVESTYDYSRTIRQYYDISVSVEFSLEEMRTIYNALGELETGLNKLTNNNGLNWISKNLSGTIITQETPERENIMNGAAHVIGNHVYLPDDFINKDWGHSIDITARSMIIHELGHVLDNNSSNKIFDATFWGGGHGDALMDFIGGKSDNFFGLRFVGGIKFEDASGKQYLFPESAKNLNYGNSATAEYFAHNFAASIVDPEIVANDTVRYWFAALIDLTR